MRISWQILLLSISLFFLNGCLNTKSLTKEKNSTPSNISAVLGKGYNTALYKAKIDVRDKHFSGLFFFKKITGSSFRIVFLSEIGLNLLDMEYKNSSFKIIRCQDFLNKKIILNTLKNDFKLLIDVPPNNNKNDIYKNSNNQISLIKIKDNSKKYYYFCAPDKKISKIIQVDGFKHIEVLIQKYNNSLPQEIEINHKRIKLKLKLSLINSK
ncbi:MAG: hypothetical protein ABFS35_11925 [Bacteroidota bacterium]